MKYRFTSAANEEVRQTLEYYEEAEPGLGAGFFDEVEAAIGRILAMPTAWKRLSVRTRRCLLHRFPHGIIYLVREGEVVIVSVMDLRRDPKRWSDLL